MSDRRNRADDAEGSMFDDGQTVVAAEHFAPHELDTRRFLAQRPKLLDLVVEPADASLFHLHRSQFDRLVDGNAANVIDDPFSIFLRSRA